MEDMKEIVSKVESLLDEAAADGCAGSCNAVRNVLLALSKACEQRRDAITHRLTGEIDNAQNFEHESEQSIRMALGLSKEC